MPESNTPTPLEQNQLRKGRAAALLIHYKNRLLGESGLPDEDTLSDLLADLCHEHTPANVQEALQRGHCHHHAEVAATEDDPEGDAAAVRYAAIREAALRKFAADGIDSDESPLLAFPDDPADNGVCVQTWTWFSFIGTPFDITAVSLPADAATARPTFDHDARFDEGGEFHAEANAASLPADKDAWCIFHNAPDREPAWHDCKTGMPVTYETKQEAELNIMDTVEQLFQDVRAGERELEDIDLNEWAEPVTLHPDGTITAEDGATYGKRED